MFLEILLTLTTIYLGSKIYRFALNYVDARKSNLPYFCIPWDQNQFFWVILSPPFKPWLSRKLPPWIWDRLTLTVYGFEFTEKLRIFDVASNQGKEKGKDGKKTLSYVMVTPGKYEVTTSDPEIVNEVLRRIKDFQQHEFNALFLERFGRNVLTSDGEVWTRQRKVVASTINEKISRSVFRESMVQTEGLLNEVGGEETGKLFEMMKKITINVLSGVGMGQSVSWDEREGGGEKPREGFRMTYIQAAKAIFNAVAGPIILPKWFLASYPGFLPGYAFMRDLSTAVDEFPVHTKHLLDKEEQVMRHGGEARSNIMSQLLKAASEASDENGKKGGKALSDEEIMGNLFVFTGAGFDTTANTLSYALVLMARYPEWQEWMHEEIYSIMPQQGDITNLDYASIFPKATRVLACMFETLRLFPPLLHIGKQTRTPQTISTSTGTYWFPANATVYVNTVALHLEANTWRNLNLKSDEKPSNDDENKFRPSRWMNASGDMYKPPSGSFIPWSAGPRVCPGQKMAQVEFTSVFLALFRQYRLEAVAMKDENGRVETREQVDARLDARMKDSAPILTLQMNNVYDVAEEKSIRLRLSRRE